LTVDSILENDPPKIDGEMIVFIYFFCNTLIKKISEPPNSLNA
jgi:hypothetical protein